MKYQIDSDKFPIEFVVRLVWLTGRKDACGSMLQSFKRKGINTLTDLIDRFSEVKNVTAIGLKNEEKLRQLIEGLGVSIPAPTVQEKPTYFRNAFPFKRSRG